MSTEKTDDAVVEDGKKAPATAKKATPLGSGSPPPPKVEHFTPDERAARARRRAPRCPARSHAEWEPPAAPAGSGRAARGAGADARAGTRADPLRADARLAVHLLPRRRVPDGVRPFRRPAHRAARPALRRRAPVELRRVRGSRPAAGLRRSTTSTRRCPARSSGTSSAWSRASRSPGATAASTPKTRREGQRWPSARVVPRGDAASSRRCEPGHLVRATRCRGGRSRLQPRARPPSSASGSRRTSPRRGRRTA